MALAALMRWLLSASPRMSPVPVSDTVPERPTSMLPTAWSRCVFSTKFRPVLSVTSLMCVLPSSVRSKLSDGAVTWYTGAVPPAVWLLVSERLVRSCALSA